MRRSAFATLAAGAVLAAACAVGGIRPAYEPFPDARVDTINALPVDVIQEAVARVNAENMRGAWESAQEGYFETQWFNVVTQESGKSDLGNLDRIEHGEIQLPSATRRSGPPALEWITDELRRTFRP